MTKKRRLMETRRPRYKFYATILDAFYGYVNSDAVWEKYWGWSENPPHTPEEFHELQFKELIDRINRVPFDNEKADRGTAFNELVDALIENRKPERMEVGRNAENTCYTVAYNNRTFVFPISLCREFAGYFKGALTQQRVEAILPTAFGDVLVYGFIDELMPTVVHDIKTTGSYTVGKFKSHFQHLVYPYALIQNGNDIRTFEYNIVEFNKGGFVVDTYTETYVFEPVRDIPILTSHCEDLIRFLEENKDLITDRKIFALE